ncbi:hypothetical protein [Acetivibrio cellulolyticus]|uniref:hypothetical protein n=1 Tax=Acetivibrio cellulolyticus TaxID=35830 RepID=UPI0001E2F563|nr:hypothetical protein [Acetivibrio cellulolyticus]
MEIAVAIIAAFLTIVILGKLEIGKTSTQLMLLGIEITIIGAVLITIFIGSNENIFLFLTGVALIVIGFVVNVFGFGQK